MRDSSRRQFLRSSALVSIIGITGCSQLTGRDDIQDTDGDGVIDSEDYAPRDPSVQRGEQVQKASPTEQQTPTETRESDSTKQQTSIEPDSDTPEPLSGDFIVEQGGVSRQITPFDRSESIKQVYDYSGFTSGLQLQKQDTARLFLYTGPNGLSFGTIIDSRSSDDGGQVTYDIDGLPRSGEWIIQDDPGDIYGDRCSWSWDGGGNTDGGVFRGGLEGDFEIEIAPNFNEGRDDPENNENGLVTQWEFVYGDISSPDILVLNTGDNVEPVAVRPINR